MQTPFTCRVCISYYTIICGRIENLMTLAGLRYSENLSLKQCHDCTASFLNSNFHDTIGV
ncbi:hypothetical protein SAMN05518872_10927 [Psychrobacillus sp. OK032]|nr:hypothetical protein SAMN05518872_10927 [Psychrobacillus sp. OK032]